MSPPRGVSLHLDPGATGALRRREPVRCGIPWPQGALSAGTHLALRDREGRSRPVQARVLDRWPDGSARWTLLDWLADTAAAPYALDVASAPGDGESELAVHRGGEGLTIQVGPVRYRIRAGDVFPFSAVEIGGADLLDPARCGLFALDEIDNRYRFVSRSVEVVEEGPLSLTVRYVGSLDCELAEPLASVTAEVSFHAGFPGLSCRIEVTNPRAAGHPGGRWSLGNRGSVYFSDLHLALALPRPRREWAEVTPAVRCSPEPEIRMGRRSLPLEIYQDSSGGRNWRSSNHVNRRGVVPHTRRGYSMSEGGRASEGLRASPVVELRRGKGSIAAACDHFWENFPKAIEVERHEVVVRLFPGRFADLHELQGGERKTHLVRLAFQDGEIDEAMVAWLRDPMLAHAEPEWYARADAIPYLVPRSEDPNRACQALVDAAIDGDQTFLAKREVVDEYGWRHFGELYGDHEAVRADPAQPLVSHYNNQYDAVGGFAAQFLRSTDRRWFRLMDELAAHVTDIDIYHTNYDKSAYNRGLFWHTVHYIDAGRATHRSYPSGEGVGGGPSSGHLYTTGLMLHYFLTGVTASRDAAIGLGQYVIDADDGTKTIFRLLDRGPTGHVSLSAFDGYHGPGRSAANSLNALLDAHRLSGRRRFMRKADELLLRCIHPEDDLERRNLGYVEGRWFYTMFLAALGRYLDYKALLGENDRMYAYARASLLHYADWAAANEYPYLEKPEVLEFPTETWAAQDMRKSEVLRIACRHAVGERRSLYQERARFFFDVSVRQLEGLDTRALCRPLVLLQALGYGQAWSERQPDDSAPRPLADWASLGPPREFVPQKVRAKRNFIWLSAAGFVGLAVLGVLKWLL